MAYTKIDEDCRSGHIIIWDRTDNKKQIFKCKNCKKQFIKTQPKEAVSR